MKGLLRDRITEGMQIICKIKNTHKEGVQSWNTSISLYHINYKEIQMSVRFPYPYTVWGI